MSSSPPSDTNHIPTGFGGEVELVGFGVEGAGEPDGFVEAGSLGSVGGVEERDHASDVFEDVDEFGPVEGACRGAELDQLSFGDGSFGGGLGDPLGDGGRVGPVVEEGLPPVRAQDVGGVQVVIGRTEALPANSCQAILTTWV